MHLDCRHRLGVSFSSLSSLSPSASLLYSSALMHNGFRVEFPNRIYTVAPFLRRLYHRLHMHEHMITDPRSSWLSKVFLLLCMRFADEEAGVSAGGRVCVSCLCWLGC